MLQRSEFGTFAKDTKKMLKTKSRVASFEKPYIINRLRETREGGRSFYFLFKQ